MIVIAILVTVGLGIALTLEVLCLQRRRLARKSSTRLSTWLTPGDHGHVPFGGHHHVGGWGDVGGHCGGFDGGGGGFGGSC